MNARAPTGDPDWPPRLKRLRLRCWRRGVKEMDLILGGWFDAEAAAMTEERITALEALLEVDDPMLLDWITGRAPAPPRHASLVAAIRAHHGLADGSS